MSEKPLMESFVANVPTVNEEPELDAESSIYKTVEFRMFCFKVLPCSKRFCHDWTNCPFAHPGEKARRRDPRAYKYSGMACPEMKLGQVCPRSAACPFAHNVFEYWLHPSRYRTQPCNDGPACTRKVCFFAHTLDELRVPSDKSDNILGDSLTDENSEKTHHSRTKTIDGLERILTDASFGLNHSTPGTCSSIDDNPLENENPIIRIESIDKVNEKQERTVKDNMLDISDSLPLLPSCLSSMSQFSRSESLSSTYQTSDTENVALAALEQHHLPYLEQNFFDLLSSDCEKSSHETTSIGSFFNNTQNRLNLGNSNIGSALESGLHWNGGPPRLFVDKNINHTLSSFKEKVFVPPSGSSFSSETDNRANDNSELSFFNTPYQPFFLASLLSNFQNS